MVELEEKIVLSERLTASCRSELSRLSYEEELAKIKDLKVSIERDFGDVEKRYLGEVFAASLIEDRRYGLPVGHTNDWALIEVPRDNHEMWTTHNRLSFRGDEEDELGRSNPDALPHLPEVPGDVHQISSIIPRSTLESGGVAVFKIGATRGPTHRLTLGQTNGHPSYSRTRTRIWSTRSAIISCPREFRYSSNRTCSFAAAGDSGAAVVSRDGQMCGIVTAGTGGYHQYDIIYFNTIHDILDEIKSTVGMDLVLA